MVKGTKTTRPSRRATPIPSAVYPWMSRVWTAFFLHPSIFFSSPAAVRRRPHKFLPIIPHFFPGEKGAEAAPWDSLRAQRSILPDQGL